MVLVFVETENGKVRKAALEAVYYGYLTAQKLGTSCQALLLGNAEDATSLGLYGATLVHQNDSISFNFLTIRFIVLRLLRQQKS